MGRVQEPLARGLGVGVAPAQGAGTDISLLGTAASAPPFSARPLAQTDPTELPLEVLFLGSDYV